MKRIISLIWLLTFLIGCAHFSKNEGLDPELSNYTYPREVKYFDMESQDQKLRMAYMIAKPEKENGQTVLLLHGKNFSAAYWEPTIQVLLKQGFSVIAPDQIGFGKSSKPKAYQFTFHQLAHNTKYLLDSLNIKDVHVVGHSMGGMLATRFALMFPGQTKKLILVNPIGLEDWKTMIPYKPIEEIYQSELRSSEESIREYQKNAYFDGVWREEYEPLIEILAGWTKHPDYPEVAWNAALTTDMIFTQPVLYEFPLLKAKTLLIIGTRDRTAVGRAWASESVKPKLGNYEVLGKKAKRTIPKARLVEFKNIGHMPQIEVFDQYSKALIEFLSE